jgi:hypothetical protein
MGQVRQFASTTVAPKLAVLGAIEDSSNVGVELYDAIEADITRG